MEVAEKTLHNEMPAHVKKVMSSKKILLYEALLKEAGVECDYLNQGLRNGFDLLGVVPDSGLFQPRKQQRATAKTKEELWNEAGWRVEQVMKSCRAACDPLDDEALLKETEEEVKRGWADGPYTREELDQDLGRGRWIAARRFCIAQLSAGTPKRRLIDDFT
eukprot:2702872-Amphidinium_carterae.1